jgi:hypothetical protein
MEGKRGDSNKKITQTERIAFSELLNYFGWSNSWVRGLMKLNNRIDSSLLARMAR